MSKFSLELSYKNIFILKHSLEKRIEQDKTEYERLKNLCDGIIFENFIP